MKVFLDDIRNAPDGWTRVKNIEEFEAIVSNPNNVIEEISFDHDLGVDTNEKELPTGYDCAIEELI